MTFLLEHGKNDAVAVKLLSRTADVEDFNQKENVQQAAVARFYKVLAFENFELHTTI
jgi:hypothetical protein